MKRFGVMAAAAVSAASLGVATAGSASATTELFYQAFQSGSYHASKDFTPSKGAVKLGLSCKPRGSTSEYAYASLVTTAGSNVVYSGYDWPCDGGWHNEYNRVATNAAGGTSYYLRWTGIDGYNAPTSGVQAFR